MDPSQDRSQDLSQDILSQDRSQENTFRLPMAVVEPHAIPLPIPLSPLSLVPSSHPPSPAPSPSPPPSPIASSSNLNTDPSSSLTPPQSLAVTHYMPPLLYYAPAPAGQYIQPGWNPETGLPMDVWLRVFHILWKRRNAITLLACVTSDCGCMKTSTGLLRMFATHRGMQSALQQSTFCQRNGMTSQPDLLLPSQLLLYDWQVSAHSQKCIH
ncbi:hypothetical protein NLI96_g7592 [Meripilus lineatus]|uniref:Uncharacterized protein n=1 Tax=Meripilus lineatus TaxID=2056292 RepID=A0AAD5V123_9APHY|nr:hypothetical protein NLI96_g7592 [Physisporinus lineatus]